jgi:protein-S-isoprenylcysteine O-methyltransferase Ste14
VSPRARRKYTQALSRTASVRLFLCASLLVVSPFVWWISTHACMHAFIARDEQFPAEQFGDSYVPYKRQVRRWV